jgi:hypothetical protein
MLMLNRQPRMGLLRGLDRRDPFPPTPPGVSGLSWRGFLNALLLALSAWGK